MPAGILIVGQGLAGTLLGWEFERAGIPFTIADPGHGQAATSAAAGVINPITGRRLVKSWRIEALLPAAKSMYREIEAALGVTLWHAMRVRRLFADARERTVAEEKRERGELAPFVAAVDDEGFWIENAARVALGTLLSASRARWQAAGKLKAVAIDHRSEFGGHELVIDCRGVAAARDSEFGFVPWEFSKGEILELEVLGLESDVVLNRRHWIVPVRTGIAWVGATHEPGVVDPAPTTAARRILEASARELLGADRLVAVGGHRAGVRVNLPDKRPMAGRHPERPQLGIINGLGAKGALWAPMLARQWVNHLTEGVPFEWEVDVRRFC